MEHFISAEESMLFKLAPGMVVIPLAMAIIVLCCGGRLANAAATNPRHVPFGLGFILVLGVSIFPTDIFVWFSKLQIAQGNGSIGEVWLWLVASHIFGLVVSFTWPVLSSQFARSSITSYFASVIPLCLTLDAYNVLLLFCLEPLSVPFWCHVAALLATNALRGSGWLHR